MARRGSRTKGSGYPRTATFRRAKKTPQQRASSAKRARARMKRAWTLKKRKGISIAQALRQV
jgi:hypothetical protein